MPNLNQNRLKDRVRRARSAVGRGTRYRLGRGGFDPSLKLPAQSGDCDCSGFLSWALGISRHQRDKDKPWSKAIPWIETTAIYKDAKGKKLLFTKISEPVPGCLVVYPDRWLGVKQGHVAIVSTVSSDGKSFDIIDCSSRGVREAINERPGVWMLGRKAIFAVLNEDFE